MGFEYQRDFVDFLPEHGVPQAARNYVSWMNKASRTVGRPLGPADLFDDTTVERLLEELQKHPEAVFIRDRKMESNLRSTCRKYAQMVQSNFRGLFGAVPASPTPVSNDARLDELPERVRQEIYRVVRDTQVTRRLKRLYEFRCQICGKRLEIEPGRFYVEAHHLKPLGEPHNGPDIEANVVCVCPNCYTLLDYNAMPIQPETLKICRHDIATEYIEHHNQRCH